MEASDPRAPLPGVVLLIGQPGAGKSLLGARLEKDHPGSTFLSVGQTLRDAGLVEQQMAHPTVARAAEMNQQSRELLELACSKLTKPPLRAADPVGGTSSSQLLLLECVKSLDDAFVLMEVLRHHEVPLLQVLYLPGSSGVAAALRGAQHDDQASAQRDRERRVAERLPKWEASAAQLVVFFSSLGVLCEVSVVPSAEQHVQGSRSTGRRVMPQPLASLAAHGYAAATPALVASAGPLVWPGLTPPTELRFTPLQPVVSARLVTDATLRDSVLSGAAHSAGLRSLPGVGGVLPVPTAAVADSADAAWVAWPGRYRVSRKADGTRHLLIVAANGACYYLNRAGLLYAYPTALTSATATDGEDGGGSAGSGGADSCAGADPSSGSGSGSGNGSVSSSGSGSSSTAVSCGGPAPGSVLDGELVWVGGRGFFLAFDVICDGSHVTWQQPLAARLLALEHLLPVEAEDSQQLQHAARLAAAAALIAPGPPTQSRLKAAPPLRSGVASGPAAAPQLDLCRQKQQAPAPGHDAVTLVRKQHLAVSADALEELAANGAGCPYPTDGLVFTPCAMPYALGMAELLYKWQPAPLAAADLTGRDHARTSMWHHPFSGDALLPWLVYECVPAGARDARKAWGPWHPVACRWDRARGNGAEAISRMKARAQRPFTHLSLVAVVQRIQQRAAGASAAEGPTAQVQEQSILRHPAYELPFDELYTRVMDAVGGGSVERTVADGGLEVFNYRGDAPQGEAERLCRGLVLHPASRSVVAAPFVRFGAFDWRMVAESPEEEQVGAGCSVCGCSAEVDSAGDTVCFCDTCHGSGRHCDNLGATPLTDPDQARQSPAAYGCDVCGCSAEVGADGERICYCDTCHGSGRSCYPGTLYVAPQELACLACYNAKTDPSNERNCDGCFWRRRYGAVRRCGDSWRRPAPAAGSSSSSSSSGSSASTRVVSASLKVDGSHAIVFMWQGRLRVTTRRRMDSEQALWASEWLHAHATVPAFEAGWTYLFEVVGKVSTTVVAYAFDHLVLLGARAPNGCTIGTEERCSLASRLGVMAVPCLSGSLKELSERLPGMQAQDRFTTRAAFEGWVLTLCDGSHHKLVQPAFQRAHLQCQLLHPLSVWDLVRCGGRSREELLQALPRHLHPDLRAILEALEVRFCSVCDALQACRQQTEAAASAAAAASGTLEVAAAPTTAWALASLLSALVVSGGRGGGSGGGGGSFAQPQLPFARSSTGSPAGGLVPAPPAPAEPPLLGPGAEPAALHLVPGAFDRALAYCVRQLQPQHARISSHMFHNRSQEVGGAPRLRGLILDCIQPGRDGALPGYTPSRIFAATWAKGWASGPRAGRMAMPPALITVTLNDDELWAVLGLLEGRALGHALRVCRPWADLIKAAPDFQTRAARAAVQRAAQQLADREAEERRGQQLRRFASDGLFGRAGSL